MVQVQGSVLAVATVTQGGQALGWSGNSLSVVNAADFSRSGGSLQFDDHETVYTYTGVVEGEVDGDPDAVLMASAAPSPITYPDERRVNVWPLTVDMFAEVALPEDRDAALQVEVPHALRPLLAEGVRDEADRESVLLEMRGLSWVLTDVLGYDTPNLADVEAEAGEALTVAGSASADAGQAVIDAADAAAAAGGASGVLYGTAAIPPSTRRNGSPLQPGDLYYQIVVGSSRIAAIRIRSATGTWDSHQLVADSVLVPSSVGDVLLDKGQVFADLKIVSPNIETNPAADRGIKIIDDMLTGYSSTGEKLIEIGGPSGLIKGVTIEGVTIEGTDIYGGTITGAEIETTRGITANDIGNDYFSMSATKLTMNREVRGGWPAVIGGMRLQNEVEKFGIHFDVIGTQHGLGMYVNEKKVATENPKDYPWQTFGNGLRHRVHNGVMYLGGRITFTFGTSYTAVATLPEKPEASIYGPLNQRGIVKGNYFISSSSGEVMMRSNLGTVSDFDLEDMTPFLIA